jgi:hypothetical protein
LRRAYDSLGFEEATGVDEMFRQLVLGLRSSAGPPGIFCTLPSGEVF